MRALLSTVVVLGLLPCLPAADPKPLKLLFLGDPTGHHVPAQRYRQLAPALAAHKIEITYTDKMDALNPKTLAGYDGLIIYANIDTITPDQEKALLDFVEKGFIPLHCASYCFRNSQKYVDLVGAQFQKHGTGTFRVTPAVKDHPITKGYGGFESWDETYVHTKHNPKDRTILEYREDKDGKEPWTWVRTQGKGRVFYTAWGHDERTFGNEGFVNLIERGIRWACGDDPGTVPAFFDIPVMTGPKKDTKPFEYVEAKVPFYPPGGRGSGQPLNRMQKPLSPEESAQHYQHPADLEMKLFASEPSFGGKPLAMNWDERGRLWVCVSVDYPNEMKREGEGRDKIVVCEDTDGDGVADKFTVFADKLSIPTSLTFAYGGIVVHQAPHTLFLKDTDGDGKADVRKILFSGWGTNDTHAGPSNLRYGPDGWYYGMVGYSGFNGTVAGERLRFSQGLYRFKLAQDAKTGDVSVTKFEFLRGTSNNSWGVGFSEDGLLFGSTANGCASVYLAIPNRYYEKVRGWSSTVLPNIATSNAIHPITDKIRQVDFHNGFTAAAGHALYTARAYPQQSWNRTAFVCEPTGHLAATMVLQKKGTDFAARYGWNLVAGDDEWIAPTMAEVGPDGSVWVIDWYAFIVQHNPTPVGFKTGKGGAYETDLRDKAHGRVYRLVPKGVKAQPFTLAGATDEQLVAALSNPTMLWRLHAQRLLTEKQATAVVPALAKLVSDQKVDEVGLNVGALHAIWTIVGLGDVDFNKDSGVQAIREGMVHPSAAVRRAAVLALPRAPGAATLIKCDDLLQDSDPNVRLAALLTLSELEPNAVAAKRIAELFTRPEVFEDRWLPDALTAAAAAHDLMVLKKIAPQKLSPKALAVVSTISEHLARRAPDKGVDTLVIGLGSADPKTAETIVAALAKGWPKGKATALTPETEKALAGLLAKFPTAGKGNLVKLAAAWGSTAFDKYSAEIAKSLTETLGDEKAADEARIAAAKQLTEFRPADGAAAEAILDTISPRTGPALAAGLIDALANSTSPEVGPGIAKRYAAWPPSARVAALRVLLGRPDATRALLDAAEKGIIPLAELALDQKQGLAAHPDRAIATRAKAILAKGGGLPNADRQKVIDELIGVTKKDGDAVAGKAMFLKHCAACHQHTGEGTKIGPDLTGMAVHPKEELLVNILDPSRSVEGNFRLYKVTTTAGELFQGMLASETKTSIELIDSQAKKSVVLREDIDTLEATTKSLMPDGFEKQMNPDELTNLLAFLTKRGKYLPLPLDKAATIVSTKGMFYDEAAPEQRLVFADWKPKTFEGVPFLLVDPQGDRVPNVIMLNSPTGKVAARMPKSATVPVNAPAKTIHMLGGVSGWGYPYGPKGTTSMIVRLTYDDGQTEDHPLKNGEQLADYIRKEEVPGSKYAFNVQGKQVRYLTLSPKRTNVIKQIEFVKGSDNTAPVVVAVTIE